MADFDPPFGNVADKRYPTSDEQQQGFTCGGADIELFRGMFHRIEAEIGAVITAAGIPQSNTDLTQLYQAILAHIAAASGGGEPNDYILIAQARGRLPIFPHVQTVDGRITVITSGGSSIRVPGGVEFLHRGIWPVTTVQTDFATAPSKIYHVRWHSVEGIVFRDLADPIYNPSALAETHPVFDSGYDDMLIARVITSSSNIATITNLANLDRLFLTQASGGPATRNPANLDAYLFTGTVQQNWSRTPRIFAASGFLGVAAINPGGVMDGIANAIENKTHSRYSAAARITTDWHNVISVASPTGHIEFTLAA
ncbi:hypothetical protein FPY71_10005 [Aureimonas fodinaquatilis]|uniref:Uncharacterized protein n=1 Tax=Aureimonas fodinaquatilis TaxID=2565783 RepID=A0A5B0DZZ7_9HYPH|nr:hypothetical protein [Aureimonas fodinaquatilis]KAA0970799.1 hypothetical protein FPY71_10005 [Aureimonas fodinaquatilis]